LGRGFSGSDALAKVASVLTNTWVASSNVVERALDDDKQDIILAALVTATIGTTAYAYVDINKPGRKIFLKLREAYKGTESKQKCAEDANCNIQLVEFGCCSKLSADTFTFKFLQCLHHLCSSRLF
jgi:hypothetical protein